MGFQQSSTNLQGSSKKYQQIGLGASDGGIQQQSFPGSLAPTAISGLVFYINSSQGITLNGSNVAAWGDQSGFANHVTQSNAAEQPFYSGSAGPNNLPAITFASNRNLRVPAGASLKPSQITMFCVFKTSATTAWQHALSLTSTSNWQDGYGLGKPNALIANTFGGWVDKYNITNVTITQSNNVWHILTSRYNGLNLQVWLDGTSKGTTPFSSSITYATSELCIGGAKDLTGYAYTLNGDIAFAGIYNRALTDSEVNNLTRWLSSQTAIPINFG